MAFLFKHLSLSGEIEGLHREEELSIPYKALRMSMERLLGFHDSRPHNPIIANVLYKSTILESRGRGIKLMIGEFRRVSIHNPEFHADSGFPWVVFRYTWVVAGKDHPSTTQVPSKWKT